MRPGKYTTIVAFGALFILDGLAQRQRMAPPEIQDMRGAQVVRPAASR